MQARLNKSVVPQSPISPRARRKRKQKVPENSNDIKASYMALAAIYEYEEQRTRATAIAYKKERSEKEEMLNDLKRVMAEIVERVAEQTQFPKKVSPRVCVQAALDGKQNALFREPSVNLSDSKTPQDLFSRFGRDPNAFFVYKQRSGFVKLAKRFTRSWKSQDTAVGDSGHSKPLQSEGTSFSMTPKLPLIPAAQMRPKANNVRRFLTKSVVSPPAADGKFCSQRNRSSLSPMGKQQEQQQQQYQSLSSEVPQVPEVPGAELADAQGTLHIELQALSSAEGTPRRRREVRRARRPPLYAHQRRLIGQIHNRVANEATSTRQASRLESFIRACKREERAVGAELRTSKQEVRVTQALAESYREVSNKVDEIGPVSPIILRRLFLDKQKEEEDFKSEMSDIIFKYRNTPADRKHYQLLYPSAHKRKLIQDLKK